MTSKKSGIEIGRIAAPKVSRKASTENPLACVSISFVYNLTRAVDFIDRWVSILAVQWSSFHSFLLSLFFFFPWKLILCQHSTFLVARFKIWSNWKLKQHWSSNIEAFFSGFMPRNSYKYILLELLVAVVLNSNIFQGEKQLLNTQLFTFIVKSHIYLLTYCMSFFSCTCRFILFFFLISRYDYCYYKVGRIIIKKPTFLYLVHCQMIG